MLQISRMSPHTRNPSPRRIEVDLSAILVPRVTPGPGEVIHPPVPENSPHQRTGRSIDSDDTGIGPSGWSNINFVAVSSLVALFCAVFVSDNFEYARRRAHLKDDVVYQRRDLDSTTAESFALDPAQLVSRMELDHDKMGGISEQEPVSDPSPALPTLQPARELQTFASSPNIGRVGESVSTGNSSSAHSETAGGESASRATSSKSTSANGSTRSVSVRSSVARSTPHSRRLSGVQLPRHSLANGCGKPGVGKSVSQTSRPTISGLKSNDQQSRLTTSQTQTVAGRNVMSMHSMGQASVVTQSRGAMNPMRMESGMLAQPSMGAGLGGLGGNGLGGAGNHGGNARR